MRNVIFLLALAGAVLAGGCFCPCEQAGSCDEEQCRLVGEREPMKVAHNVYFTLKEDSAAARHKLVADCYAYLQGQPGIEYFAAGAIVEEHERAVNVRDWDVGLHIIFDSKTAHDAYQNAGDHHAFIDANQDNWEQVRVFDTFIEK